MAFKFFTIPIQGSEQAEDELNAFLRSHKVLTFECRRPLRTEPLWPRESAGSTVACGDWDRAMRGERRAEVGLRWWGRGYQR
jgi:hypothetical protein